MEILWTQNAYDSLSDILDYSAAYFGINQVDVIEAKIQEAVDRIALFPKSCPVIPEISNATKIYRKLVVSHEISIIYKEEDSVLWIEFVWDIRRSLHHIFYVINPS